MNSLLTSLVTIAQKKEKSVLGLMSGTSMDGLDLALCRIGGHGAQTTVELTEFRTMPYSPRLKKQLKGIVSVPECSLEEVCLMHGYLGDFMGQAVLEVLEGWGREPASVDSIASHGQTIYHAPAASHQRPGFPHATLQIGDGDHIAQRTGILTVSDFRQKHTAAGGEGAPMVALVEQMLFDDSGEDQLLLNIGGIANVTYLPASTTDAGPVSGDTGPGNTLLDEAARRFLNKPYDTGGECARSGAVVEPLLAALREAPYFGLDLPRTTGPELFNWEYVRKACQASGVGSITPENLLTTLTEFTARTIADAIAGIHPSGALQVLVSGGGMHNVYLMERLQRHLGEASFLSFGEKYFNADAKEAVCFAILANETLSGEGFYTGSAADKRQKKIHPGKISFPN